MHELEARTRVEPLGQSGGGDSVCAIQPRNAAAPWARNASVSFSNRHRPRVLERAVEGLWRPSAAQRPAVLVGDLNIPTVARLRGHDPAGVVVDLEDYARIAKVAR